MSQNAFTTIDPRTHNATKFGLFAAHAFIRENEHEEYTRTAEALRLDLAPQSALQELLTSEVIGAAWRLRRCNLVEASLITQSDLDPMADETTGKIQKSVDRARAQSHTIIRRSIAEMRKLQTAAPKPNEPLNFFDIDPENLDLNNPAHFAAFDHLIQTSPLAGATGAFACRPSPTEDLICKTPETPAEPETLICKKAATHTPAPSRNAPCPCGSGIKYKKCCWLTPVQPKNEVPIAA